VARWSEERIEDFHSEMWLAVHEGAFLFELPGGSVDHTADGIVKHGPWPAEDCSQAMLTWFDHGWIMLYVLPEQLFRWGPGADALVTDPDDSSVRLLDHDSARIILADPRTWTSERAEGFVCLGPTGHAPSSDFRELWLNALEARD
jgi:hypothetical protein